MKFLVSLLSSLVFGQFWFTTLFAQDQSLIRQGIIPATEEHDTIKFGVMTPLSYQDNSKRYPVIYYLHGLNGQYSGWQAQTVAEFFTEHTINGDTPECIIVFPDGREGLWLDHYDGDPLLEKEVIEILIPHIDLNYPVDVEKQLIMGWSAGGAGAVNFFSKHPALFKACISLDGSITTWEEFQYFQGERPKAVNNSDYFYEYCSPNEWMERNESIIKQKQDTAIFLVASFFIESHQTFLSILNGQEIPFQYRELNCNHEFGCVFSESSSDLLSYLSRILN